MWVLSGYVETAAVAEGGYQVAGRRTLESRGETLEIKGKENGFCLV